LFDKEEKKFSKGRRREKTKQKKDRKNVEKRKKLQRCYDIDLQEKGEKGKGIG